MQMSQWFDLLGGKIRPNAEFWIDVANRHPTTEAVTRYYVDAEHPEWKEWMGKQAPDEIAAAYVTVVKRSDRSHPFTELNYCKKDDPILYEVRYMDGLPAGPFDTVKAAVIAQLDASAGEVFEIGRASCRERV